jgi:CBS-domain-containing membrane protein
MIKEDENIIKTKLREIRAKDIMSRFAVTVKEDESLLDVAHRMMRLRISGAPVVSEIGKIAGIITVTDLCKIMEGSVSQNIPDRYNVRKNSLVKDVMTRDVFTITSETDLLAIITLMGNKNIHTIPVVDQDLIVGIVGRRDVIYAYYSVFMNSNE